MREVTVLFCGRAKIDVCQISHICENRWRIHNVYWEIMKEKKRILMNTELHGKIKLHASYVVRGFSPWLFMSSVLCDMIFATWEYVLLFKNQTFKICVYPSIYKKKGSQSEVMIRMRILNKVTSNLIPRSDAGRNHICESLIISNMVAATNPPSFILPNLLVSGPCFSWGFLFWCYSGISSCTKQILENFITPGI